MINSNTAIGVMCSIKITYLPVAKMPEKIITINTATHAEAKHIESAILYLMRTTNKRKIQGRN
jgi:hypothetical protein